MSYYLINTKQDKKVLITKEEAQAFAMTPNDQSFTIKRIGLTIQRRLWESLPIDHPDIITNRKDQKTGVMHDGSRAHKYFGRWATLESAPDDNGNSQPVYFDYKYYPEAAADIIATEQEYKMIQENKVDYYEFLRIDKEKTKRLENNNFTNIKQLLNKND